MTNPTQLCLKHGGQATWAFSQRSFSVLRRLFSNPKTRWGICAGLSAHWITNHAKDGTLATLLGGGGVGSLNETKLREIADLHSHVSQGDGEQQTIAIGEWLESQGIVPVQTQDRVLSSRPKFLKTYPQGWQAVHREQGRSEQRPTRFSDMSTELAAEIKRHKNCYLRVNFNGTVMGQSTGHAIAVFIGQETKISHGDAVMFDPNYGEFWFKSKADFLAFFPEFFKAKYLSGMSSFNQGLEVLPCNPKV